MTVLNASVPANTGAPSFTLPIRAIRSRKVPSLSQATNRPPTTAWNGNNINNYAIRVARVEWISMKKIGYLSYTDEEGSQIEDIVDDTFASSFKLFKEMYPDAELEWDWINEAWEGGKSPAKKAKKKAKK